MKYIQFLIVFLAFSLLFSCSPKGNLVYFSDLSDTTAYTSQILNDIEPKIRVDDILGITVSTLNIESNALFNQGVTGTLSTDYMGNIKGTNSDGYLVDKNGYINYPVIGKIHVAGLTKEAATTVMRSKIAESVKDPIVNIRFLNFRISVIGEVLRPGSFIVPNEKINILEALGLAGDMTPFGRRENVLIIREVEGKRTMARLNLNEQTALNSPFFYLQQNDVVYVEPDKYKDRAKIDNYKIFSLILTGLSVLTLAATRFNW